LGRDLTARRSIGEDDPSRLAPAAKPGLALFMAAMLAPIVIAAPINFAITGQ
jgi:hypothetical protein